MIGASIQGGGGYFKSDGQQAVDQSALERRDVRW